MFDEHDSWFQPFGFDPAKFAEEKWKAAQEAVGSVVQKVEDEVKTFAKAVVQKVEDGAKKVISVATGGGGAKPAAGGGGKAPDTGGMSSLSALKGSVGAGGVNNADDVRAVQAALGIAVDGQCGGGTIGAIKAFQKSIGQANPDGRVDVGGATARALAGGGGGAGGGSGPSPDAKPEDDGIVGGLKSLGGKILDGAKDLGGSIVDSVEDLGGKILDGAKTLVDDAKKLGGQILDGAGGLPGGALNHLGGGNKNPLEMPEVQAEIDGLALGQLKNLAHSAAEHAFTIYLDAIRDVNGGIKEQADAAKKSAQLKFEIAVAMAVVAAGPLAAAAAGALAGTALTGTLVNILRQELPKITNKAGVGPVADVAAAANECIARLAGKYSAADAVRILGAAIQSLSKTVSVFGAADKFALGKAYLHSLKTVADANTKTLHPLIERATSFSELIGIYDACVKNTPDSYRASISKEVENFMEVIAPVIIREKNPPSANGPVEYGRVMMVKMDAYGRIRFAQVLESTEGGSLLSGKVRTYYVFRAWVAQELEKMAASLNPKQIDPKLVKGHIPQPPADAPINVWDLPDAPTNVHDLPDAPTNVNDVPDAPK